MIGYIDPVLPAWSVCKGRLMWKMLALISPLHHTCRKLIGVLRYISVCPYVIFEMNWVTWPRLLGAVYTNLDIQFKHIFFYMNRPSVLTKPVNPNIETASFLKPHPRLKWISLDPTDLANFGSRLKWKLANSKWRTTNYCLLGYCSLKSSSISEYLDWSDCQSKFSIGFDIL